MMETASLRVELKNIKTAVDQLLTQAKWQTDIELLLNSLNSKVDIQGQRLVALEADVKIVKEFTITRHLEKLENKKQNLSNCGDSKKDGNFQKERLISLESDMRLRTLESGMGVVEDSVEINSSHSNMEDNDMDHSYQKEEKDEISQSHRLMNLESDVKFIKDFVTNLKSCSEVTDNQANCNKDEILQVVRSCSEDVKSLVIHGVESLGNVFGQCSADVATKFENVDKKMTDVMSGMKGVIEQVAANKGARSQHDNSNIPALPTPRSIKVEPMESTDQTPSTVSEAVTTNATFLTDSFQDKNFEQFCLIKSCLESKYDILLNTFTMINESVGIIQNDVKYLRSDFENQLDIVSKKSMMNRNSIDIIENNTKISVQNSKILLSECKNILDQNVAESQINREMFMNTRKKRKTYKGDFYVRNFSLRIKQSSTLWYIDQLDTHVKGAVLFMNNGNRMEIWLGHGRYPAVLGLKNKKSNLKFKCTVKIFREGKDLFQVGHEDSFDMAESEIAPDSDGWDSTYGFSLANICCAELIANGYVDKHDRLLLKYEISLINENV